MTTFLWLFLIAHISLNDNTTGVLCTQYDPDFDGYRYKEQVAHCGRNISAAVKREVASRYHIAKKDYRRYEFDHLIPLAFGGSNSAANIWPQPLYEARQKDSLEVELYYQLRSGRILQRDAIRRIFAWRAH